jgi:DDE superfamily endonuclease
LATGIHEDGSEIMEDISPFILADSAYANTKTMVTTYKITETNSNIAISALNWKLGGAWYHVENAFGILKACFQIFERALNCAKEDVRFAIILCATAFVLHNFLIDEKDNLLEEELGNALNARQIEEKEEEDEEDAQYLEQEEVCTRDTLI